MEKHTLMNIYFIGVTIVLAPVSSAPRKLNSVEEKQAKRDILIAAAQFPPNYQGFIRSVAGLVERERDLNQNHAGYYFSRRIDSLGRFVIPKEFREALALEKDTSMNIYSNGKIFIVIPQKFDALPSALKNMIFASSSFPALYQPLLLHVAAMAISTEVCFSVEDMNNLSKEKPEAKRTKESIPPRVG